MALNFTKSDTEPKKARKYRDFSLIGIKTVNIFLKSEDKVENKIALLLNNIVKYVLLPGFQHGKKSFRL